MTDLTPTDEQAHIISLVKTSKANLLVNALAGTGKTTTLDLIQAASPVKPILCLAFSKRIADEMEKRFPTTTSVRTFNSLGHRIWAKAVPKIAFNSKKMQDILRDMISARKGEDRQELREAYWEIVGAIGLAKSLGYIPEGTAHWQNRLLNESQFHASLDEKPSPLIADFIDLALTTSIKAAYEGVIDYNDQIYMPALFGGTFPQFPLVLVDEAQDLSPTNHAMLDKLVRGRICAVGDRWQSIYGFRGAQTNGMGRLQEKFEMQECDLSISFRCPRVIVEAARWRVPHFKWIKEGGTYETLSRISPYDFPDNSAIICRNNAPLFRLAFGLLSIQRSVTVAGSDIGPRIVRLLQKLGPEQTTQAQLIGKIAEWKEEKLLSTNSPSTICDMAACMQVFASYGATLGLAVAYAEHLFKQQGSIRLLTGHKAKGGEWETVYHLDPWLIGDGEQELNLRYVIQTRAMQTGYEIETKGITW